MTNMVVVDASWVVAELVQLYHGKLLLNKDNEGCYWLAAFSINIKGGWGIHYQRLIDDTATLHSQQTSRKGKKTDTNNGGPSVRLYFSQTLDARPAYSHASHLRQMELQLQSHGLIRMIHYKKLNFLGDRQLHPTRWVNRFDGNR
jgi:hypothetical protein